MLIRVETYTVGSACAVALRPFTPDIRHLCAFVTSNHAPMTRITRQFLTHCRTVLGGQFLVEFLVGTERSKNEQT